MRRSKAERRQATEERERGVVSERGKRPREPSEQVRPAGEQLSPLPDGETVDREWLRTAQLLSTAPSYLSVMQRRKDKKVQEGRDQRSEQSSMETRELGAQL